MLSTRATVGRMLPLCPPYPWSLVYTTTVSCVAPISSILSSKRPMPSSMALAVRK